MIDLTLITAVLVIGLITGFLDAVIGAGGLFAVPALIFLGLPPQVAIATDRFGLLGHSCAALYKYGKAKQIAWKYVTTLTIIALAGALIGGAILLEMSSNLLQKLVAIVILATLPFIFFKKEVGVKRKQVTNTSKAIGFAFYFLIMVFSASFGQGIGPMIFFVFIQFLGLTMLEVLGTNVIPMAILIIVTTIMFAFNGIIDYQVGIVSLIGMALGSYLGAHLAIKKGNKWIKGVFVVLVIGLAIKLLFF